MQKRINPRKPVRPGNVGHTVNHAGSASRSRHLPRIEHVQRKSVVRLIARTVRDRRTRFQAEIGRGGRVHPSLYADGRMRLRNRPRVDPVITGDETGRLILSEVPQNLLGQSAAGRRHFSRQPVQHVIAGQHETMHSGKNFRLVLPHPGQFGGRKISGRIQQAFQTAIVSERVERSIPDLHGPAVAPNNGFSQRLARLVEAHESVHLVRDSDRFHGAGPSGPRDERPHPFPHVIPPHPGILLGPSRLRRVDRHFSRRQRHGPGALAGRHVEQRNLDRRAADVNT